MMRTAKFHPDLIWNDETLGFFERGPPNKKKNNKQKKNKINRMSSDMRSVPDLKLTDIS